MSRAYISQLESLRQSAHSDGVGCGRFFKKFAEILCATIDKSPEMDDDNVRYTAERKLSVHYWPHEFFRGQNPNLRYKFQLRSMQCKALDDGISNEQFFAVHAALRVSKGEYTDTSQYLSEKAIWTRLWGDKEPFPGQDPRRQVVEATQTVFVTSTVTMPAFLSQQLQQHAQQMLPSALSPEQRVTTMILKDKPKSVSGIEDGQVLETSSAGVLTFQQQVEPLQESITNTEAKKKSSNKKKKKRSISTPPAADSAMDSAGSKITASQVDDPHVMNLSNAAPLMPPHQGQPSRGGPSITTETKKKSGHKKKKSDTPSLLEEVSKKPAVSQTNNATATTKPHPKPVQAKPIQVKPNKAQTIDELIASSKTSGKAVAAPVTSSLKRKDAPGQPQYRKSKKAKTFAPHPQANPHQQSGSKKAKKHG